MSTYISDIISVFNAVFQFFTTEPVVYFVMFTLVNVAFSIVMKIATPLRRKLNKYY